MILLLSGPMWLLCGCGEKVGELDAAEQGNALVAEGYAALDAGKWDDAVKAFHSVLDRHPDLSRLHLDLAQLYLDHKHEPVSAIYHFRRYLMLRPDTEKRQMIESQIRDARLQVAGRATQQLRAQIIAAEGTITSNRLLRTRVSELERDVAAAQAARKQTEGTLKEALGMISRLQASEKRLSEALRRRQNPTLTSVSDTNAARSAAANAETRPRTYRVRSGDSLSKISRTVYGDGSLWHRLLEANRDVLGDDSEHLEKGQVLVVP